MPEDHRDNGSGEFCARCKFGTPVKGQNPNVLECRRFPPQVNIIVQRAAPARLPGLAASPAQAQINVMDHCSFPRVATTTWCGEWKPRAP